MPEAPNRWDALFELLKTRRHSVGAEIGIASGTTAGHLVRMLPDIARYICVDPWRGQTARERREEFMERIEGVRGLIDVIEEPSVQAADMVNVPLDWIFIDAGHRYGDVKQDIASWVPKVRKGGLITGHDYCEQHEGVIKAVDEAFDEVNVAPAQQNPIWWRQKEATCEI